MKSVWLKPHGMSLRLKSQAREQSPIGLAVNVVEFKVRQQSLMPMMLFLGSDVIIDPFQFSLSHAKCAISSLPFEKF